MWLDDETTHRQERDDMMISLRAGDKLHVMTRGDLGTGREIKGIVDAIEGRSVELLIEEVLSPPGKAGRPPVFRPDKTQDAKIKRLYHSYRKLSYVLDRASRIMGHEVARHHLVRRYGRRWPDKPLAEQEEGE